MDKSNHKNGKMYDWMNAMIKMQRYSVILTVGIIFVILTYLFLTTYSSTRLAEQTEIISSHPFEVVIAVGDIKSSISEMQIYCERLTKYREEADIARVENALNSLYADLERPMEVIEEQYLGNTQDIRMLLEMLKHLEEEQTGYIGFARQTEDLHEIEVYQEQQLMPLYEETRGRLQVMITSAQNKKVEYGEMAKQLYRLTQAGSVILVLLMIGGLLLSQFIMRHQRKELLHRSLLFDNLSNSIDDAFLIRDAKTNEVYYISLNMERVLGHEVHELSDMYSGFHTESIREVARAIEKDDFVSPYVKEVKYTLPGGEERWISVRVYRATGMKEPQYISVVSDCTEEKNARQALYDAMANAEQANEAKTVFLSRMSHEIRTPLNAVIGMTALANISLHNTEKVRYCLEKINFSSKHLLMLINDVLDMSKIESNKLTLQMEPFDLFEVVNGYVAAVYSQAKEKGIMFEEAMEGFEGLTQYCGDSLRLNQILLNLSSNAIKFTAPGGRVRLETKRMNSKSTVDIIRFLLEDTGIGMSKEALEHIFKPFEQADSSIAKRFGGTGLGMSITKSLVTLMGGSIEIRSEEGVGTTCIVDLPFQRAGGVTEEPDFANCHLRALVVDDELSACQEAAALLRRIKVEADWVTDSREAIGYLLKEQSKGHAFDLCLIDWKMPEMDGVELTRRIRADVGVDLPIVMISAYNYTEIEEEARAAGANSFLPKPLYRASVYAAIQSTMFSKTEVFSGGEAEFEGLKGKRLLLAEDNEINREIMVELLKTGEIDTECAADGKQVLQMFLAAPAGYYDAILMDVQMPVMDGYEAARHLRASKHPDAVAIPIIATTANAFREDVALALDAGMTAHIGKPIDFTALMRLLTELLIGKNTKR